MAVTDQNLSMLIVRMIWIKSYFCQVIKKDGRGLFKRDLMLFEIKFSFLWVPVKLHTLLYIQCMYLSSFASGFKIAEDFLKRLNFNDFFGFHGLFQRSSL